MSLFLPTLLLAAVSGRAEPPGLADLRAFFVSPAALGREWEVVEEAPQDPTADPDLRRSGVRAVAARHYTHGRRGRARVCSVEIWSFVDAQRAGDAVRFLTRPGWRVDREANLLVLLRGVVHERGGGFEPGLFPDCERLGDLVRARVAPRLP